MQNNFSKRFGHSSEEKEITVREDAPQGLREFIVQTIYTYNYAPSFLRRVICRTLRITPDSGNWSERPNIEYEVNNIIENCNWYQIYDIIENFYSSIDSQYKADFTNEVNDYFKQNGIGWKLENGLIETRGDITFESSVANVVSVLETANLQTAKSEIKEAINDLSRRPEPDITGAIQHSLACLECVCREVTGDKNATLGDLMKKAGGIVPPPLDQAISKIWGYSSEQGRHLREGQVPDYLEAELLVELSASVSGYIAKKIIGNNI